MLSTHDGRSVQGLGVDRTDGHVSISEFSDLRAVVESRGGKIKYRSVPKGRIPADTFEKICGEIGASPSAFGDLFLRKGEEYRLISGHADGLPRAIAKALGAHENDINEHPAVDFLVDWVLNGETPYELCCTSRSAFPPADPETEAARLTLAQVFVLSLGQNVPAIYFNDLLGLENDFEGFSESGKPRDLNRKKNRIGDVRRNIAEDPFTRLYAKAINRAVEVRAADRAFYPGSRCFEYKPLSDTIFLNHAYARESHSLVIGNIVDRRQTVRFDLESFAEMGDGRRRFVDLLSEDNRVFEGPHIDIELAPYGAAWLAQEGTA
jgi:hypothetical protein